MPGKHREGVLLGLVFDEKEGGMRYSEESGKEKCVWGAAAGAAGVGEE